MAPETHKCLWVASLWSVQMPRYYSVLKIWVIEAGEGVLLWRGQCLHRQDRWAGPSRAGQVAQPSPGEPFCSGKACATWISRQ